MSVYDMPVDSDVICTVLEALIRGSAEPVGDSAIDSIKIERQKTEEDIIYWLIDEMYSCLDKKNVYWGSGQVAGKRAEEFLQELMEDIAMHLDTEKDE